MSRRMWFQLVTKKEEFSAPQQTNPVLFWSNRALVSDTALPVRRVVTWSDFPRPPFFFMSVLAVGKQRNGALPPPSGKECSWRWPRTQNYYPICSPQIIKIDDINLLNLSAKYNINQSIDLFEALYYISQLIIRLHVYIRFACEWLYLKLE